jgi:hypothetical protein
MALTLYTKASRHFFNSGTTFVNAKSFIIWKNKTHDSEIYIFFSSVNFGIAGHKTLQKSQNVSY